MNFTNSGASVFDSGKIGKCYSFTTSNRNEMYCLDSSFLDKHINNHSFSICIWVKSSSDATTVVSLTYGI